MKTKYALQTQRKFTKNAILLIVAALALCASPAVTLATDCLPQTTWIGGKSSWFTSSNWDNGLPDSGTAALIDNGGTAQITASLPVANACSLSLGPDAGHSGNVSVSIGTLLVTTSVVVGSDYGTGSLSVTNAGTVTGGDISVGGGASGTSATGLLTLTDTSTVTAASVNVNHTGTLSGYGTVSTPNGTTTVQGTLAPKGGGTTLTIGDTLSLASGSTTQCNVTPQDPSTTAQVNVSNGGGTAQVSLGGTLLVTMTGDFSSAPTRFTLLYADSVNSMHKTFDFTSITYPTGHCWHPVITYVVDNTTGHYHVYLDRVYDCN